MKKCSICLVEKDISNFWKNKFTADGLNGRCKRCATRNKDAWNYDNQKLPLAIYKKYKRDALRRNIDFLLSEDEFINFANSSCNYCGEPLDRIRLDRINSDLNYSLSNVVPCCVKCNSFKGSFKQGEFLEHVKKIYYYQEGKKNG